MTTAVLVSDERPRTVVLLSSAGTWPLVLGIDTIISFSYTFSAGRSPSGG